jgi:hypothetical protein
VETDNLRHRTINVEADRDNDRPHNSGLKSVPLGTALASKPRHEPPLRR